VFDEFGLNVAGYLTAELGLGEVARNHIAVMRHLGIKTSLQDASFITHQRKEAHELSDFTAEGIYPVNLLCINAPEIKHFIDKFGAAYFRTKYNIGSWWWEVEELPLDWKKEFYRFDELWVGTRFIQQNLEAVSPIPVYVMPPYVVPFSAQPNRSSFNLIDDEFVFLFAFDYFSCFERKNPIGLVRAFKRAFVNKEKVKLFIKTTNAEKFKEKAEALKIEVAEDPRIILLDQYFSKAQLSSLLSSSDAYISLHRTEGFGLPIAEAMLLGKPVIVTGWSGNLDFTNEDNSLLVSYEFTTNKEDYGPYKIGMRWAEPDFEHAAKLMQRLYEDRAQAKLLGERGAATIKQLYGLESVAQTMEARLKKIVKKVHRVEQINSLKKGLLSLSKGSPSQALSSADSDLGLKAANTELESGTRLDNLERFFTSWWHRALLGKPLRLFTKGFARFLENMLSSADGIKLRSEMIEQIFESLAKVAKIDSDYIEKLEERLQALESSKSKCEVGKQDAAPSD
jgi:glycosyltransferase involved in cell wall biosynthesis